MQLCRDDCFLAQHGAKIIRDIVGNLAAVKGDSKDRGPETFKTLLADRLAGWGWGVGVNTS